MFNVPGGAGGLVDGPTDHGPRHIAILLYLRAADLHRLVVGLALVLDHANLPEILLALLLLLGLVGGDVAGVAPLVVAVVARDDLLVLGDFIHHDLDNSCGQRTFPVSSVPYQYTCVPCCQWSHSSRWH